MRKYLEVFKITLLSNTAYVYDLFFNSIFMVSVMFVFLQLWRTTYGVTGQSILGGFTLSQMIWYLVMTETIVMSVPRLTTRLDQEIKAGDIAYSLARPYSYVGFQYALFLGEAGVRLLVNYVIGGGVAWLGTGALPAVGLPLLAQALVIFLAVSLLFLNQMALGLLAFWAEDTRGFQLIYERAMWILGGLLLPVQLFPPLLRGVAEVLPFRYAINAPAQLVVQFDARQFTGLVAHQAVWLAAFGLLVFALYRAGIRRVTVNGG